MALVRQAGQQRRTWDDLVHDRAAGRFQPGAHALMLSRLGLFLADPLSHILQRIPVVHRDQNLFKRVRVVLELGQQHRA